MIDMTKVRAKVYNVSTLKHYFYKDAFIDGWKDEQMGDYENYSKMFVLRS